MHRVISIPVHESELSAIDQCLNYVLVGEFDFVVLHANALSAFDVTLFRSLVDALDPLRGRVFVNPTRVSIPFNTGSNQFVSVLHRAHIVNYLYARDFLRFEWFAMDASNSLLLRRGLPGYIVGEQDGVGVAPVNPNWEWLPAIKADPLWPFLNEDLAQCNVEGSFFHVSRFNRLLGHFAEYERLLAAESAEGKKLQEFPREELLFQTLHRNTFGAEASKTTFTYLRWHTRLVWMRDEVSAALSMQHLHLPGKYAIKRVARHPDDWLRVMVAQYYGYRHFVQEAKDRAATLIARKV